MLLWRKTFLGPGVLPAGLKSHIHIDRRKLHVTGMDRKFQRQ